MVPTRAMSLLSLTFWLWALMVSTRSDGLLMPRLMSIGVCTGGDVLHALIDEGLCQNGSGGGTVTGSIVGLGSTSRTSCAPMFSNSSFSSISLAMVTPSLVMSGLPNFLLSTTLRPRGIKGVLNCFGKLVDHWGAPFPCLICLVIMFLFNEFLEINERNQIY